MQVLRTQFNATSAEDWKRTMLELQWPTFVTNVDGVVQSWNTGCEQLLGYGTEVIGERVHTLLSTPLEGLRLDGLIRQALQGERLMGIELPFQHADGRVRLTVCSVALLKDLKGGDLGLVFTCAPWQASRAP